jgi:DNA (cytosine-5)-methyltransferase 1
LELTHLSLFTGIGGLDVAAEWAGFKTVGQCEWADYPTKILEKHWPDVPRWRDIHDFSADEFIRRTGRREVTAISGGFPCQPHSLAGKRKASDDERDLWPEYRRIVSEFEPGWVVAENVPGLLTSEDGRFFRGVLRDFAKLGFNVGWCTYPASWIGAIHKRERIFTIAHRKGFNVERVYAEQMERTQRQVELGISIEEWQRRSNIYQPKLLRNYHGTPGAIHRIECLGNMVVPQQAYPIFKAIAEIELGS